MDAPPTDWGWVPPAVAAALTGLLAWFARGWLAARSAITEQHVKSLSRQIDLRFDAMEKSNIELRGWVQSIDDKLGVHFTEDRKDKQDLAVVIQQQKTNDAEIDKLRDRLHDLRGTVTGIAMHTDYEGEVK